MSVKSILQNCVHLLTLLRAIPLSCRLAMGRSAAFEEDFERWCRWKKYPASYWGFIRLLSDFREYRTLVYYRIGYLAPLIGWLLPGEKTLHLTTKQIGGGLLINHGFATIVTARRIGKNCKIYQQVTVGYNADKMPSIGDNVEICCGAKIIGDVCVGDNCVVGANAVVVKSLPPNSVAAAPAATILKTLPEPKDLTR